MIRPEEFKVIGKFEFRSPINGRNTNTAELKYRTLFYREEEPFYQYVLTVEGGEEIFNLHLRVYLSVAVALDVITEMLKEWPEFKKFANNAYRQDGCLHWTKT
jgi:hypothetical protein